MAYLVRQLINNAYYLSGLVARNQETVSGQQVSDGLRLLNALLDFKTANNRLIPYFTYHTFNAVIGQESYFVENLIYAETLTFNLQTVRIPINMQSRIVYFGSPRVDGITALPMSGHIERVKGGSQIYLYFLPNDTYPIKLMGKFALGDVTLDQDLEEILDGFYIEYLRYALAEYLCGENNITFNPVNQKRLDSYEEIITDISPMDLSVTKMSSLQKGGGINWAFVNLSGGWVPG